MRDPGKVMQAHYDLQKESPVGLPGPMRQCSGGCRKRRSIGQFSTGSTVCKQCVRRAPKGVV